MLFGFLSVLFGMGAVFYGLKGFSPKGLPISKELALTGGKGKFVGGACVVFGVLLILIACQFIFAPCPPVRFCSGGAL